MVVGVRFHARTPHILIMTELFFATYAELILLTKVWKMHGSLSYIVVNILIELASNSARYTGGKLVIPKIRTAPVFTANRKLSLEWHLLIP